MENCIALNIPRQTNVSENVRVSIKRLASNNGGLANFCRVIGFPYKRTWERLNRNVGDLLDGVISLAKIGFDDPLRIVADACNCEMVPKMKFLRKTGVNKPIRFYEISLYHACAHITTLIEQALVDGHFKESQKDRVLAAIHELRKKMAELEARISGDAL